MAASEDRRTQDYFDRHTPHFENANLIAFAIGFVNQSESARGRPI